MSLRAGSFPLPELVPEQEFLTGYVSTVVGPIEFRVWKKKLERISEILGLSDVEKSFQRLSLGRRNGDEQREAEKENRPFRPLSVGEQASYQRLSSQVLRCNVAQTLMGEDFRGFSCRLSESELLQWFCKLDRLEGVRIPGKSTLQRYSQWLPEADMRKVIDTLLVAADGKDEDGKQPLGLAAGLNLESYFLDTTCVRLNIHFPVDWVLLRDAARTLMKATMLIRQRGLKVRMGEPRKFLKAMNRLSMEMTQKARRAGSRRARKATLRRMKRPLKIVQAHARRHRDLLAKRWRETDLSQAEAQQIIQRIDTILERLPQAVKQAHERIIGGRQVPNGEKILSLYEGHAAVYVRGKAGAEVEFGSQLLLSETRSGLIADGELVCGNPEHDTVLMKRRLDRDQAHRVKEAVGDRGFDSQSARTMLAERGVENGIIPRDPKMLRTRLREERFRELSKRRGQTEARIGIFKNVFLGAPLLAKGYENQARQVAWAALAHNLWLLTDLPVKRKTALRQAA